jgi:hypothetical protein
MKASVRRWVPLSAMAVIAVGCGPSKHTITADDALRRMDGYVQETIRSVPTSLRFSDRKAETWYTGGCTRGIIGDDFTGQIQPTLTYTAKTPTTGDSEVRAFFTDVAAYWKSKSASVESEHPDLLTVQPYKNGYRLFVDYYPESHKVELGGVLKDCIWRNGTAQPDDNP